MLKVVWRGQPVFVVRRTKAVLDGLSGHDDLLADPTSATRCSPIHQGCRTCAQPEYWVVSPFALTWVARRWARSNRMLRRNWRAPIWAKAGQRVLLPCHGSKYDISGRVFKSMPAPKNLTVLLTRSPGCAIAIGVDETRRLLKNDEKRLSNGST